MDCVVEGRSEASLDLFHRAIAGEELPREITLDQVLFLRPAGQAQDYRMPVPGVYLCGAGAHPGGNISGAPGHNAAREILKDVRAQKRVMGAA